jgi:hypothetical protein
MHNCSAVQAWGNTCGIGTATPPSRRLSPSWNCRAAQSGWGGQRPHRRHVGVALQRHVQAQAGQAGQGTQDTPHLQAQPHPRLTDVVPAAPLMRAHCCLARCVVRVRLASWVNVMRVLSPTLDTWRSGQDETGQRLQRGAVAAEVESTPSRDTDGKRSPRHPQRWAHYSTRLVKL